MTNRQRREGKKGEGEKGEEAIGPASQTTKEPDLRLDLDMGICYMRFPTRARGEGASGFGLMKRASQVASEALFKNPPAVAPAMSVLITKKKRGVRSLQKADFF